MKTWKEIDDQSLSEILVSRIRWDIRVSNSDISMIVKKGKVTLLGYFDADFRHEAAVQVITTTDGVLEFEDRSLVLQDYHRTDQELEVLVNKQILKMDLLPGEWIDVAVSRGSVRLEGSVFRTHIKASAARFAWELSGVRDCLNYIEMRSPQGDLVRARVSVAPSLSMQQ